MPDALLMDAICLRGYDFSESSRALHFYSPQAGLIRAVAKGMRGARSPLAGVGEKLAISRLHLRPGPSLATIIQYQTVESFAHVRGDLLALAMASVLAEVVHRLGGEQDHEAAVIYDTLREALYRLEGQAAQSAQGVGPQEATRIGSQALWALLAASGYAPTLNACVVSGEALDWYAPFHPFSAELGGVLGPEAARAYPATEDGTRTRRVNVSSATLRALCDPAQVDWQRVEPQRLLGFLRYYLTYRLERPLRAFEFLLTLLATPPAIASHPNPLP